MNCKKECMEQKKDGMLKDCPIIKENAELKEKIKGLENGDVAWQGDMDATIKQNLELKEQIEEMKNCLNCAKLERTIKSLQLKLNTNGCDSVTDYMRYLKERDKVEKLKKDVLELKQVLEHREKCIDWILEKYPEVITAYLQREENER